MAKALVFISIITSMIGSANIFALNLGFIQLSPFRVCSLLLLLYMIIVEKKIKMNRNKDNFYSIVFMFVWVIYSLFSLAWVKDYDSWIKALFFLIIGLLVFVLFSNHLTDRIDILKSFRLIFIIVAIHNIIGWYEIFTENYLFLSIERIAQYARYGYPVSTFGNTNDYATFMLFSVYVSYICLINAKTHVMKVIYLLGLISSAFQMGATNSRANLLGLILSIMLFVFLSIRYKKTRHTVLLLLGIAFIVILIKPEILTNLSLTIDENLTFNFASQSGSDGVRMNLIRNGLLFLGSTFGFGVGAGNIEYWIEHKAIYDTGGITNMHNWWLEILVAYGVIIFIMYIVFFVKLFISLYRKYKASKDKVNRSISLGIMCFMAGFVIGSVSSSSNINSEWMWVFWGISVAYQGIKEKEIVSKSLL